MQFYSNGKMRFALLIVLIALSCTQAFLNSLFGNTDLDVDVLVPAMLPQFDPPLKKTVVSTYGAHPSKFNEYAGISFTCKNGAVIPIESVNDDFCDCGDDEPGTAACSEHDSAKFYCLNAGFKVIPITASRIDDGVCDCCSGEDEGSVVVCENVCEHTLAKEMEEDAQRKESYLQGRILRDAYVKEAHANIQNNGVGLESASDEIMELERKLDDLQTSYDESLSHRDEEMEHAKVQAIEDQAQLLKLDMFSDAQLGDCLSSVLDAMDISSHETGSLLKAFRDGGENGEGDDEPIVQEAEVNESGEAIVNAEEEADFDISSEEAKGFLLHVIWEKKCYDEVQTILAYFYTEKSFEGAKEYCSEKSGQLADPESCAAAYNKIEDPTDLEYFCTINSRLKEYVESIDNFVDNTDNSELETTRSQIETKRAKLEEVNKYREDFTKFQELDGLAFIALKGTCSTLKHGKYEYELCFGEQVSQKDTENDGVTSMGSFDRIERKNAIAGYNLYFTNGQNCWNHGPREAIVSVECGRVDHISAVGEPSTCLYELVMHSPAACTNAYKEKHNL